MFNLNKDQLEKLNIWQREIIRLTPDNSVSGGRFTYSFTPTSLGEIIVVKEYYTGDEIDLSEYDNW